MSISSRPKDAITVEYLMSKHNYLRREQAEDLLAFCHSISIAHVECYSDTVYGLWVDKKIELQKTHIYDWVDAGIAAKLEPLYPGGVPVWKISSTNKKQMKKQIKMSLETARQMHKTADETTKKWLLENFTKEELEPKKGFTWEDSFNPGGCWIESDSKIVYEEASKPHDTHKNVFLTEKHAKSALAFAQLSHIVAKYNEGKEMQNRVYTVDAYRIGTLSVNERFNYVNKLEFYKEDDAKTSMKVNRQLWLDYWMID